MGPVRPLDVNVATAIKVPRTVRSSLAVLEQSVYAGFVRVAIVGTIKSMLSRLNIARVMTPISRLIAGRTQIFELLLNLIAAKRGIIHNGLSLKNARSGKCQRCGQDGNV